MDGETGLIVRRFVLERDPPIDIPAAVRLIVDSFGMSGGAWVLNVPRETLRSWLNGHKPNFEDGRAVVKLSEHCRNIATQTEHAA